MPQSGKRNRFYLRQRVNKIKIREESTQNESLHNQNNRGCSESIIVHIDICTSDTQNKEHSAKSISFTSLITMQRIFHHKN